MSANAVDDLYLRTDYKNENVWNTDDAGYKFTFVGTNASNEDVYEITIKAEDIKKADVWFRLHLHSWGNSISPYKDGSYTYAFSNGQWETYDARYEQGDFQSSDKSFGIRHSTIKANEYRITVYRGNSADDNNVKHMYIKVEIVSMPVSIKAAGYGTFSCDRALDFTDCDVTPYVATGYSADGKVTMKKVTKVPANTGLFLKGTPGTALNSSISVIANDAEGLFSGVNLLKHGTGGTVNSDGTTYRYVFQASDLCFKKLSTTGANVPIGKAYLELPANQGAPSLSIELDGETTGIKVINFEEENTQNDGQMFDLQGRRVAEPTKGVYIVNGKKVIIK